MPAFNFVWRSAYHDSVTLMRLARDLESVPGVARAAAMMGTPGNRALMQDAGLLTSAAEAAGPIDLVIAVVADDETTARQAEEAVRAALSGRATASRGSSEMPRPRPLASALRAAPDPNIALISIPGLDPATSVVCVIGKPPGGTVARRLESQIARLGKPCALHFVGSTTASLEDCARDAVALARGEKHQPVAFTIPDAEVAHMVSEARRGRRPEQRFVRGVYSGGTLAWEARSVLDTTLGDVPPGATGTRAGHRVVDLGEDVFTVGRPHPMIDGTVRREWIDREGRDAGTAVLLVDVVLGYGAHRDPAGEIVPAIRAVRARRPLAVVASVCGTDGDPQSRAAQIATLRDAGVIVLDGT